MRGGKGGADLVSCEGVLAYSKTHTLVTANLKIAMCGKPKF